MNTGIDYGEAWGRRLEADARSFSKQTGIP
jgi:hypothetical protein